MRRRETTARRSGLEHFLVYASAVLFLSTLVLPASILECSGQAGSATVAVSPPSITASVGQDFSIDINISSVSDLYGWEFYLGWNSSLLSLVSVNEGPFLQSGGNTYFSYFLNTTGEHVVVDCTLEGEIPGVSGDGTLATVTFNTTNAGECPLNLYNVDLRDSSDAEIPCEAVSGNFTSMLHDVAVTNVTASPTVGLPGTIVNVNVTVQDEGQFAEVFNLTAYANSQAIGTQQISLNTGDLENLSFTWNTTGYGKGDYNISASVNLAPGEVNLGNSTGTANTPVTILTPGHDIAVIGLILSKTVIGQGYNLSIEVSVQDFGVFSETFNVTTYANQTTIGEMFNVTLTSGNSTTVQFTWNTTGFALLYPSNYTISAYAWPVPGQTDTADNNCTGGWVIVSLVGDVTGPNGWPDGKVDILDVNYVARLYGTTPSSPNWNPNADISGYGKVDIRDVNIVAKNYGQHYP